VRGLKMHLAGADLPLFYNSSTRARVCSDAVMGIMKFAGTSVVSNRLVSSRNSSACRTSVSRVRNIVPIMQLIGHPMSTGV